MPVPPSDPPPPDTSEISFTHAALRSGLVNRQQIDRVTQRIGHNDEASMAATLVRSGVLTQYQSDQLTAGRTKLNLGPYVITDWIGQGGMGQVFKAVHRVMGRVCAVKVLPLEKSTEASRDSFMREIRLQAELDHPNVVRAYDAGRDGSVHYLVTELVPGTDLRNLIRNDGPLPQSNAISIIVQVARGLQYAHDIGLIHRDIKPGNILVTQQGNAKLSDIGLATWTMGLQDDPRAGKIVGTADYLSPEQIQTPGEIDHLSDIYSLGCTLYFCVTGKVPYPGGDAKSKCRRHREETPLHPRKYADDLTEEFVDIIADMMEKDPRQRLQSATEVAQRLERIRSNQAPIQFPIRNDPRFAGLSDDTEPSFELGPDQKTSAIAPTPLWTISDPTIKAPPTSLNDQRGQKLAERILWNSIILMIGIALGILIRPYIDMQ